MRSARSCTPPDGDQDVSIMRDPEGTGTRDPAGPQLRGEGSSPQRPTGGRRTTGGSSADHLDRTPEPPPRGARALTLAPDPLDADLAVRVAVAALDEHPGATLDRVVSGPADLFTAHLTSWYGREVVVQIDRDLTVLGWFQPAR
jgi:hypothetical protein